MAEPLWLNLGTATLGPTLGESREQRRDGIAARVESTSGDCAPHIAVVALMTAMTAALYNGSGILYDSEHMRVRDVIVNAA
jgi:hypothetical protein